jgi:DnaK suppressor protein
MIREEGTMRNVRQRLEREREAAIARLRELGLSPDTETNAPDGVAGDVRDEGDLAEASHRHDLSLMHRERVAERINQLTAALRRVEDGSYGRCERCGRDIEPARLKALPEATTCLACQERAERDRAA